MMKRLQDASSGKVARGLWPADRRLAGLRALSVLMAVVVAVVTLLPSRTEQRVSLLAGGRAIGDELNGFMVLGVVAMLAVVLILAAWKSRLAWRLKMSWPLFLCAALYLVGLAILVSTTLRGGVYGLLISAAPEWLDLLTASMDAEHAITYAAFTIVVAIAWRQKVPLLWLAAVLFAYGYALEQAQKLVPGRDFGWGDVAANGLGIALGAIGILLFDVLADHRKGRALPASGDRRRHATKASRRSSGRSSRRAWRAMVTVLVGALIALASILVGAIAEIRFAQVGWQIFTQFSAPYVFTFWIGVLIAAWGWYGLFAKKARRGVRLRSPRSELAPSGLEQTDGSQMADRRDH